MRSLPIARLNRPRPEAIRADSAIHKAVGLVHKAAPSVFVIPNDAEPLAEHLPGGSEGLAVSRPDQFEYPVGQQLDDELADAGHHRAEISIDTQATAPHDRAFFDLISSQKRTGEIPELLNCCGRSLGTR